MSEISKYTKRLRCRDLTLKLIDLDCKRLTNAELRELTDCLLAHPDVATGVFLRDNRLTDETGVKVARYVAASSTIQWLNMSYNRFGSATYLALAAALRVNSSLRWLYLYGNLTVDRKSIDAAFIDAIRLNPVRPVESEWQLYSYTKDFNRLNHAASKTTPPSMLEFLLCVHFNTEKK
jgi:hypothetical protein